MEQVGSLLYGIPNIAITVLSKYQMQFTLLLFTREL